MSISQLSKDHINHILDGTKINWYADRVAAWERGERIAPVTIDMALTTTCNMACLPSGELVTMLDGTEKPIEKIMIGDYVKSIDKKGELVAGKVINSGITSLSKNILLLTMSNGRIRCTEDHKILTKSGWVEAGKLKENDEIASVSETNRSSEEVCGISKEPLQVTRRKNESFRKAKGTKQKKNIHFRASETNVREDVSTSEIWSNSKRPTEKLGKRTSQKEVLQDAVGRQVFGWPNDRIWKRNYSGEHVEEKSNVEKRNSSENEQNKNREASRISFKKSKRILEKRNLETNSTFFGEQRGSFSKNEKQKPNEKSFDCGEGIKNKERNLSHRSITSLEVYRAVDKKSYWPEQSRGVIRNNAESVGIYIRGRREMLDRSLSEWEMQEPRFYMEGQTPTHSASLPFQLLASSQERQRRFRGGFGLPESRMECIHSLGRRVKEERFDFSKSYGVVEWNSVEKIESIGNQEVYDIEVETHHNFIASGFVVHNCEFCYRYLQHNTYYKITKDHMTAFLDDCAEIGVKGVSLVSDGESSISPAYQHSIEYGHSLGISMASGTNAYLLKGDLLHSVFPKLTYLRVNISAGERGRYDEIMGAKGDMFETVCENIRHMVKMKKAGTSNCTVGMQMVFKPDYEDQLIPLAQLAVDLEADYLVIKHCSDDEFGTLGVAYDQYEKTYPTLKKAEAMSNDKTVIKVKWSKIHECTFEGAVRSYQRCYGTPFLLQISGTGLVAPCGMLFNERYKKDYHIGNFTETRFKNIWESDRYWEVVKRLASPEFDAQTMCGSLCLQHSVNKALDNHVKGFRKIEQAAEAFPLHGGFI